MKNLFVYRRNFNLKHFLFTFFSLALLMSILSCAKENDDDCCSACIDFKDISFKAIDRNHEVFKQFATTDMYKIINEYVFDKEHEINLISIEKNPFRVLSISIINPKDNITKDYQIMYDSNNDKFIAEGWWVTEKEVKNHSYKKITEIKVQSILDSNSYIEISIDNLNMTSSIFYTGNLQDWEDRWDRCMRRRFDEIFNNWVSAAFCLSNPGACVLSVAAECAFEASRP